MCAVKVNLEPTLEAVKANVGDVLYRLGADVLKDDMNVYVPLQDGHLRRSAEVSQRGEKGISITWNTPYAEKQYYTHPSDGLGKNPLATKEWDKAASAKFMTRWTTVFKKYMGDKL